LYVEGEQTAYDLGTIPRTRPGTIVLGIVAGMAIGAALAWAPSQMVFILIGIIFLLLPFFHLEGAFYGMVALIALPHFRLPVTDTFSISFSSLVMFSIAISLISRRVIRRESILGFQPRKFWPLWAFVLAHFASLAASVNIATSAGIILHLLIWILLLLVTMQVINSRRMLRNVLLLMVIEALVITLIWAYSKMDQITSIQHYVGGIDYLYVHRGDYAFYTSIIIPIVIAFILYERIGPVRLFNFTAGIILASSFVLTFSRAAWVGCIVGLIVFMRNWRVWVIALAAVLVLYMVTPEATKLRFRSIWDQSLSTTNQERLLILASGLVLAKQHPILGVGTGNFENAMKNTRVSTLLPHKISAHNLYLEVLTETGIVGFLTLCWFFYFITRSIWGIKIRGPDDNEARLYKFGLMAIWVSLVVQYLAGVGLYNSLPWFLFGLIFAANKLFGKEEGTPGQSTG